MEGWQKQKQKGWGGRGAAWPRVEVKYGGWRERESSGGITNRLLCCNGRGLIAAEMESTLQVLTECSTSGAGPQKEQIIALV